MSEGKSFFPPMAAAHSVEAVFEGGPLHTQVRAIAVADKIIDVSRLIGNIPTGLVNLETVQYLRAEKPLSEGPNTTRWRYTYIAPKADTDV